MTNKYLEKIAANIGADAVKAIKGTIGSLKHKGLSQGTKTALIGSASGAIAGGAITYKMNKAKKN